MPNFGSLLKMVQYVPMAYEFFRAIMPAAQSPQRNNEVLEELEHFQKNVSSRIADMEEEIARLRARVREAESLAMSLQVWLYIGVTATFILAILAIILAYFKK